MHTERRQRASCPSASCSQLCYIKFKV